MVIGLDHVQLACPSGVEATARAFYGGLLGLLEIEKPEPLRSRGGCWFWAGSHQLHLGVEEPFRPAAKAHPALLVDNAQAVFEKLQQAGVPCAWDTALPDVVRFYAADPWGNRLELIQAP